MLEGVKLSLDLVQKSKAFKKFGVNFYAKPNPACAQFQYMSDDYWECIIRHFSYITYHDVGTCKMGPNPGEDVVNSRLQVHGVDNLRVADASIMPNLVSANTQASCYVIGEKASDMILEDRYYRLKMK